MNVLLHACCGVCASAVVERLLCDGHPVTLYFYNPNIHPVDEYKRRLEAAKKVALEWGVGFVEGPYDRERWFESVRGAEREPEGGKRCEICYRLRLEKTYEYMKWNNFDAFTTTLSVSPHKDARLINDIGIDIGGDRFIVADFKKKGGFQRANELSEEWGLYRQNYCGCVYSEEEMHRREKSQ